MVKDGDDIVVIGQSHEDKQSPREVEDKMKQVSPLMFDERKGAMGRDLLK